MGFARAEVREPDLIRDLIGEGVRWAACADREIVGTGIAHWDLALEGGLSTGAFCEFVSPSPSSGGQTVLLHLLLMARKERRFAVLIDGMDSFDPQSVPAILLEHLLWVRCASAKQAMLAADVAMRDDNLGMILVDLRMNDARELRRTKPHEWYRLQRLAGKSNLLACVFTPRPMAPSAQIRVGLAGRFAAVQADATASEAAEEIGFEALRLRGKDKSEFGQLVALA